MVYAVCNSGMFGDYEDVFSAEVSQPFGNSLNRIDF